MPPLLLAEDSGNGPLRRAPPHPAPKEAARSSPGFGPRRRPRSSPPEKGGGMGFPPSPAPWGSQPDDGGILARAGPCSQLPAGSRSLSARAAAREDVSDTKPQGKPRRSRAVITY